MTDHSADPFEALRIPDTPVRPSAPFAARLRARLETDLGFDAAADAADSPHTPTALVPGALPTVDEPANLFYCTFPTPDMAKATAFYSAVFGWEIHDGFVASTTQPMSINDTYEPLRPTVWLTVPDIHAVTDKVRELGGEADEPVLYDSGWSVNCRSPQGTRFSLSVGAEGYRSEPQYGRGHGDLFYFALPVGDAAEATTFFGEVLGWDFGPQGSEGGLNVRNMVTEGGLGAGREGDDPEFWFRVDDLDATMARIVELGGEVSEPFEAPEGTHVTCRDDQGTEFNISAPADGY